MITTFLVLVSTFLTLAAAAMSNPPYKGGEFYAALLFGGLAAAGWVCVGLRFA